MWVIPPEQNAAFVYHLEDILEVYQRPFDEHRPLVCCDEQPTQLVREVREALAPMPGQLERYDYEYHREGTANLFMFFAPLAAWRHVKVTERRSKVDFAHCMRDLVDSHFPQATTITVVRDQLNTHGPDALYEAFPPEEAVRILNRIEFHYTPKHGSWLNMAEIELSVLTRQCLSRRIPDKHSLEREISAWEVARNTSRASVDWRFTTADARHQTQAPLPVNLCLTNH